MFDRFPFVRDILEFFKKINLRYILLGVLIISLGVGLIYRLFALQIVHGEEYLDNFQLRIRRNIAIPSTRGNIYDRNGKLLAYNDLAYDVTLKDELEEGSTHNANLNKVVNDAIDVIESHGDQVTSNFNIRYNHLENTYEFSVQGASLLRFLADVYGYPTTDELKDEERNRDANGVIEDLCSSRRFGIGEYVEVKKEDGTTLRVFEAMKGYEDDKDRLLKVVTIRYLLNLNSFQKYVPTNIATNVSGDTVAAILENTDTIEGINIEDDTVRKYVDSKYFAQILGYTGQIDTDELAELSLIDSSYDGNDIVGKSGIEKSMETELQGTKGQETVYVDNLGKEIGSTNVVQPVAGNNVYLTIDKDLQEAAYDILEKNMADILLAKIQNIREYIPDADASAADIIIPIYDVYYAVIRNNVISMDHMAGAEAGPVEKAVYNTFVSTQNEVLQTLHNEVYSNLTPYNQLTKEYQDYESYVIQKLKNTGVIDMTRVNTKDDTYIEWTKNETISMTEFLQYCIPQDWSNATIIGMPQKYADSNETFEAVIAYTEDLLRNDSEFSKHIYHYMLLDNRISGAQICEILLEQGIVTVSDTEANYLYSGVITAYQFMRTRISNRDLTPAQLNLDPYAGSMVITDVNTGDVLALVSYPSFDNNRMANGVDAIYYEQLRNDQSTPLLNFATQQRTAPGSTFKLVTSTASLMEGVITTDSIVECTGTFTKIGEPAPHCWIWPRGAHGDVNVSEAIMHSCNNFFYEMGFRLGTDENGEYNSDIGIQKLQTYASMYGLNETSGIEIEEATPQMSDEDAVRSAIGQGNAAYTTVGLARYVSAVANSGTCYNLTLVDRTESTSGELLNNNEATVRNVIQMDTSYWNAIHTGMRNVVGSLSAYIGFPVNVAGKTGTAQESKDRPNHALFVCYAPYEAPQIAVATRIANGYTSSYAAQITKDVLSYYFNVQSRDEIMSAPASIVAETGD